jgi:signal transduction histidine kinase
MSHAARFWEQLDPGEKSEIHRLARRLSYEPGTEIFHQGADGDGVYLIESGEVRICLHGSNDDEREINRLGPGDFFGEMAVLDDTPRSASAVAATAVTVQFFPRGEVLDLLDRMPGVAVALLRQISARFRDFSRQHLEEILKAERLALVGRFAGSIVHDIRNPLNLISVSAELACQQIVSPELRAIARARILKQVDRISSLIGEVLDFSRDEDSRLVLASVDFARLFQLFLEEFRPRLEHSGTELVLETPPPAVSLPADPNRLERVFHNLLNNACDAMPGGGKIFVRFRVTDKSLITEVEDTGPGIAEELKDRLFQPFATHGKAAGTGLGLSICKRIVTGHGGTIHARTEPGHGAIFVVELPRSRS